MNAKRILLAFLVTLALGSYALAHENEQDDRYGRYDARQYGFNRGYDDGYRHGASDRDRRAGFDYRDEDWRRADRGYDGSMGSKGQFRQGYRDGYQQGYEDAFYNRRRRGGWRDDDDRWYGNDRRRHDDDGWKQRRDREYAGEGAYRVGYYDGMEFALRDANRNRRFNLEGNDAWRDADHGFRGGDKRLYQQQYRQGFQAGYRQTYERRSRARRSAYDVGYWDGVEFALRDANRQRPYNPTSSDAYRDADHYFPGGDKDRYKREYRQGYMRGYDETFGQQNGSQRPGGR